MEGHQVHGSTQDRYDSVQYDYYDSFFRKNNSLLFSLKNPKYFALWFPFCLFPSSFFQVRALYDFTGESGTAELSITAGEVLTVIRDNVGDGWCEGFNQSGQSGLFPAAYVQVIEQAVSSSSMCSILIYIKYILHVHCIIYFYHILI